MAKDYIDEDLYDQNPNEGSEDKKEEMEQESFLVPKSAFMGKPIEIGEEYYFRVTGVHENEVAMVYSTEPKGQEDHEDNPGLYD